MCIIIMRLRPNSYIYQDMFRYSYRRHFNYCPYLWSPRAARQIWDDVPWIRERMEWHDGYTWRLCAVPRCSSQGQPEIRQRFVDFYLKRVCSTAWNQTGWQLLRRHSLNWLYWAWKNANSSSGLTINPASLCSTDLPMTVLIPMIYTYH